MRNKIRTFRKQRGITLDRLGLLIGLTAQSLSRIENGKMRLSTEWLARIADALNVSPLDLLDTETASGPQLIGEINAGGVCAEQAVQSFRIELPVAPAIVVRMAQSCGPYRMGEFLVCSRLPTAQLSHALTRDCVVALPSGETRLCRLAARIKIPRKPYLYTLAGLESGSWVLQNQPLAWAAPVKMRLQLIA